ncbi:MAG: hypothetical protein ACYC3I_00025 [Gemmataceae bacterium]
MESGEITDLVWLCDHIGGIFAGFLQGVNESLAEGVGSRALRAKLTDGIAAADATIQECVGLSESLADSAAPQRLANALHELRSKVEAVREELATIMDFASTPPAVPSFDKLTEAAKGPFVRLRN